MRPSVHAGVHTVIDLKSLWQWLGEMVHAALVALDPGEDPVET